MKVAFKKHLFELDLFDKIDQGLFCFYWSNRSTSTYICLEFFIKKEFRLWGFKELYYDGPIKFIGLGPLAIFTYRT
jgi:hypothetical protein